MNPSPNAVDQDDLITSDDGHQSCERCGYVWTPQNGTPLQCALCHSNYYRRPLKIDDPVAKAEHQRKARERASRRRLRENKQAKVKRLKRIASGLGRESVEVVQRMFHEIKPKPILSIEQRPAVGMPPPPKFED